MWFSTASGKIRLCLFQSNWKRLLPATYQKQNIYYFTTQQGCESQHFTWLEPLKPINSHWHTSLTESREGTWPKIGASRNPRVARGYRRDCRQCRRAALFVNRRWFNLNLAEKSVDTISWGYPKLSGREYVTLDQFSLRSQTPMLSKRLPRLLWCEGRRTKWRTKGKLVRQQEQLLK